MALYYSITGVNPNTLITATVSSSHNSSTSIATIETTQLNVDLGDHITVDLGYDTDHKQLFSGYVKSIQRNVPENTYIITANDDLIRAIDMFIVPSNPDQPLTYSNITDTQLITNILALANLTSVDIGTSNFTFGVSNPFEVMQVSSYDFCKSIAELLAFNIWCDENGVVKFKNRKPFPMKDSEPQPGWVNDTAISYVWSDEKTLEISKSVDEANLRNRVVVYGTTGVYAEAVNSGSPYFHYKTAVLADATMIADNTMAQQIADYNLHLFDRVNDAISATLVGDCDLLPFRTVNVDSTKLGIDDEYYILSTEHNMSAGGYITRVELRK